MEAALHISTRVLPGNRIEITAPELREGDPVDVFLVMPRDRPPCRQSTVEFLDSLPAGPRSFDTWEEFERHFQQERDSWDR